jgi:hypothetical protein
VAGFGFGCVGLGSGFFVSPVGFGSGLEAGFSSDEEDEDEAPAAPLHFFSASIHFLRSSAVVVARRRS